MGLFSFFKKKRDEQKEIFIENKDENIEEPTESNIDEEILLTLSDEVEISIADSTSKDEIQENVINYEELEDYDPTKDLSNYSSPPIDLLKTSEGSKIDVEAIEATKAKIISILQESQIEVLSIKVTIGYVNNLYEVLPKAGFRISKIKQLKDDLAFALLVPKLSIEAIMERGTIGIIIPNKDFRILPLKPLIDSPDFIETEFELPLVLGRTMNTQNFIVDLVKQPHILIAGATGQGKSVLLNNIIVSLLYKKHPAELKLILVDTHGLEFNLYSFIEKHYLAKLPNSGKAIISEPSKALDAFRSLCKEMDDRYELFLKSNSRNIQEYNLKFKKRMLNPLQGHRFLPYIVSVIDEYFDLAMFTDKEIESYLIRLTRKSHIAGIHIILATQRPTKDIITGELKANFPVRIAFNVASAMESRIIINKNGAEDLSGRGDCLYLEGISLTRIQVPYINTEEIEGIVSFIENQQGYPFAFMLPEYIDSSNSFVGNIDLNERDPLFEETARLIVIHQQGSTSLIQRKFAIGYGRAGRLMDQLEAAGIVGETQGSKARDVLIANEYILEQLLKGLQNIRMRS